MLMISLLCATTPAIPTPKGMRISSIRAFLTASSSSETEQIWLQSVPEVGVAGSAAASVFVTGCDNQEWVSSQMYLYLNITLFQNTGNKSNPILQ
jgi:hypothetical protein